MPTSNCHSCLLIEWRHAYLFIYLFVIMITTTTISSSKSFIYVWFGQKKLENSTCCSLIDGISMDCSRGCFRDVYFTLLAKYTPTIESKMSQYTHTDICNNKQLTQRHLVPKPWCEKITRKFLGQLHPQPVPFIR